ncbi:hypothetical protein NXT3_PB00079 (plasmid) [Sinorhizobium fredii]|uniref:Uncharacterized protein n=1 Tax=Rhizobium fredii TaxID=380 RepID=A0A2L0HB52_RHIFR|nr:hypothetical protein NXT3_PB00079 [Sinorhizobium fredii]
MPAGNQEWRPDRTLGHLGSRGGELLPHLQGFATGGSSCLLRVVPTGRRSYAGLPPHCSVVRRVALLFLNRTPQTGMMITSSPRKRIHELLPAAAAAAGAAVVRSVASAVQAATSAAAVMMARMMLLNIIFPLRSEISDGRGIAPLGAWRFDPDQMEKLDCLSQPRIWRRQ